MESGIIMLNQPTKNTLNALFSSMDKQELDEALDMLLDEALRKNWDEHILKDERKEKTND